MKRVSHRDRLVPAGDVAGEFHRDADGRRAAWREQHLGQVARRELGQALGEGDGRLVGEAPRAESQVVELPLDRIDDPWMRVADLVDAVPVKIHGAPPGGIGQVNAVAAGQLGEARR